MRLILFVLTVVLLSSGAMAQQVAPIGPETEIPSVDDLDTLPETEADEGGGKAVSDGTQDIDSLDSLFEQLAITEAPELAAVIARKIQTVWLESGSDTVDVLMIRAATALQADDYGLSLDLLDVVVTLAPDFAEGWNRRATVFYMQEKFGRSLTDIERTLALEPRHWGALSGLGIIQRRLGQDDAALTTFQRALKIHPGLGNAKEAVETLQKAAEGEPV